MPVLVNASRDIKCPNDHEFHLEMIHTCQDGENYLCPLCLTGGNANNIHPLPDGLKPSPATPTEYPPDLAFVLEGKQPIEEPDGDNGQGVTVIQDGVQQAPTGITVAEGPMGQPGSAKSLEEQQTIEAEREGRDPPKKPEKIRVHQLAKECGMPTGELMRRMNEAGHEVKSPFNVVPENLATWCRSNLKPQ